MSPIPIAVCGKEAANVKYCIELIAPEYEVVHVFHSVQTATEELPPLMRGDSVKPSSGFGTNASSIPSKIPQAIVVGGGFPADEIAEMRKLEGAGKVAWLKADLSRAAETDGLTGRDFMAVLIDRTKALFRKHQFGETGGEQGDGQLWSY